MKEAPRKTGKWLRDDIPHTGWRCIVIDERGGICEMCEVTQIVYAHRMVHDRYPLWLDCGCVCAGFMAEEPATEQLRELCSTSGASSNGIRQSRSYGARVGTVAAVSKVMSSAGALVTGFTTAP
jgi:hypothetical protein